MDSLSPCGCISSAIDGRLMQLCANHTTHAPMTMLISEQTKQAIFDPLLHFIKLFNGIKL